MLLAPLALLACSLHVFGGQAQSIVAKQPQGQWKKWADVQVTWSHPSPQPSDWVGAFVKNWPATYILWKPVANSSGWPGPTGSLSFRLLNGRHSFIFKYFRGDAVLAESGEVQPLGNAPQQGHLGLIPKRPDAVMLSWASGSTSPTPIVRWGSSRKKLIFTADAASVKYTPADLAACRGVSPISPRTTMFENISQHHIRCGSDCYPDDAAESLYLDPGFLHNATLGPLKPATRYYYSFGEEGGLMSEVFSFASPRLAGDTSSFSFLFTGDMGIGPIAEGEEGGATDNDPPVNGADKVVAALLRDPAVASDEFMFLNGDISYARGWPWIWERYFDLIEPLSTAMPWMVSVGNHEVDTLSNPFKPAAGHDSGGECGLVTQKRFHFESARQMWYSFDYGLVHFVALSSEHELEPQIEFFKADMQQLDRRATPWVIVALHRPLFSSQPGGLLKARLALTWHGLFVAAEVDVVLGSHEHYYERLCAVKGPLSCSTTRDRPVYIVEGIAGAEFSPAFTPKSALTKYKDFEKWGYSRFNVSSSSLSFSHYHVDNQLADRVTLPARAASLASDEAEWVV